jgi:K+:H+ antiporter
VRKNILIYAALVLVFGAGVLMILQTGRGLETRHAFLPPAGEPSASEGGSAGGLGGNLRHPLAVLLLQVLVILCASRITGTLFRRMAQPAVIGEMVAGILLGPSFLGMLAPRAQSYLFPSSSLALLQAISQVGVVLFMFVVGTEIDTLQIRRQAHAAVLVSHASIVVPFFLGTALALLLYGSFSPSDIPFAAFALFLGIAMSITAFPVLARILKERGLSGTPLGNTALACAAVDDVTAWCMLAVVIAVVQAQALSGAVLTILLAVLFIAVMLFLVKPLAGRFAGEPPEGAARGRALMTGTLILIFASALFTEVIGIHALFGAFLAGVALSPQTRLRGFLKERLEPICTVFLLPLFFACAGLRTQLGLLDDTGSYLAFLAVIAVAIAGKLGAGTLAARWTGLGWHEALSIGALMNTRGLIELVVLNIGYDLGILAPRMYSIMVLMAVVTTCMTGPLLSIFERRKEAALASSRAAIARTF